MKLLLDYKKIIEYLSSFCKWTFVAAVTGIIGGLVGSSFHICIDKATELRAQYAWLLFLMPLGGIFIRLMYRKFVTQRHINTNLVIRSLRENNKIPLVMIPMIYISTVITQLVGGSAGREGAALQLGGSIGYNMGKLMRFNDNNMHIIVMSGMASVFSALFGTPITAAIFSLEVASVGLIDYTALLPCVISAVVAFGTSRLFGIPPVRFSGIDFGNANAEIMLKVIFLSLLCAVLSIAFCVAIEKCSHMAVKVFKNGYIRTVVLSLVLIGGALLLGTYDYNGAGMNVVERAMTGNASPFAFALKIAFTAITLSAGFKGGEIVPAFFVGSTFGCVVAPLIGLDAAFGAAIGFVAFFCGVVNCPLASLLLSIEVFGANGILFFATACSVSYMMSGHFGLYSSQKLLFSKTDNQFLGNDET